MHSSKLLATSVALVLCLVIPISLAQNFPFPQSIVNYMATRSMRYHHYMWHQVRENWNRFSSSTQRMFRNINWAPPNPSRDGRGNQITNNFAGEDFLYMHRQMLGMARQYGSFSSWSTIPAPGDSTYPVPAMYGQKGSNDFKTNNYYYSRIQGEERTLKDPNYLRRISLNQLGTRIEAGIHNSMHMRWSAASSMGYRGEISANNGVPNVNRQWDNVRYNWLVDTYASQCNPYFYKLHGWIDDRVEDWRRANGLSSIMWRGTWTGGPLSSLGVLKEGANVDGMDMHDEEPGDVLVEAFNIFQKSGVPEFFIGDNGNTLPPNKRKTVKKCRKAPKKVKKI